MEFILLFFRSEDKSNLKKKTLKITCTEKVELKFSFFLRVELKFSYEGDIPKNYVPWEVARAEISQDFWENPQMQQGTPRVGVWKVLSNESKLQKTSENHENSDCARVPRPPSSSTNDMVSHGPARTRGGKAHVPVSFDLRTGRKVWHLQHWIARKMWRKYDGAPVKSFTEYNWSTWFLQGDWKQFAITYDL